MPAAGQDLRFALRTLARAGARLHGRGGAVARDRHRREHRHLQRRERAAAAPAARTRTPIGWSSSGIARPGSGITEDWFSTAQYFDIKNGHHGFDDVAIAIGANDNLTGDGEPERIGTIRVSSNLLPMLGARPAHRPAVHRRRRSCRARRRPRCSATAPGCGATAATAGVIGRSLTLNGQPYQIVGVLPASFSLPREVMPTLGVAEDAEVVLPLPLGRRAPPQSATARTTTSSATLKPGVTRRAGAGRDGRAHRAAPARASRFLSAERRPDVRRRAAAGAGRRATCGRAPRARGAVGFVLLIACANVANLLLSRALARQQGDGGPRGARRAAAARIVRQLLTESLLLALAGGALGSRARGLVPRTASALLGARERAAPARDRIDGAVLLFTLAVSIAVGRAVRPGAGAAAVDGSICRAR